MVRARILPLAGLIAALAAVPAPAAKKPRALQPFASCGELVTYAKQHATRAVRTGWTPAPMLIAAPRPEAVPVTAKGGEPVPAGQDTAMAGEDFSGTNVQEQGVDEPDVVKTDGTTLFAVANGHLHALDVSGPEPLLLGDLELDEGYGHEILLHGDKLLVLQNAWLDQDGGIGRPVTRMTEVDVSDPIAMTVLRRERADGEYVSARLTGDTARVVLASRAPVLYDVQAAGAVGKRLRQVRRASLAAWRPHSFFRDTRRPARARLRVLTKCGQVRHTQRFSGLDTVTILTVDLARGLPSVDADAVMSDAQIVYGSPDRLYVATQKWLSPRAMQRPEPPATSTTQIHQFDTSAPDRTSYVASGEVPGYLLNQFAMSEHRGALRVASTEEPQWWPRGGDAGEGSAVTTLDVGTMARTGRVGGLGRGERIFAVRFLGDRGYVVTFRQVDPLYVLDLADPAAPRVTGELKVAGYSAYLHPLAGDLLLGVGQDATAEGATTGTQVSLFDVADPANPKRLAQHAITGGSSTAEFDHHAFLYWPNTKLAVLPLSVYDYESGTPPFVGAIGLRIDPGGIAEVGRIQHPADADFLWDVQRATVVGDRLFTLSAAGVLTSALDTLAPGPFVGFPSKPAYGGGCVTEPMAGAPEDSSVVCASPVAD